MTTPTAPILLVPPIALNVATRYAWHDNQCVRLAPLETDLLLRLMQEPGRVVRFEILKDCLWDGRHTAAQLYSTVGRLRDKLAVIGCRDCVQPAPLRGYWFAPAREFEGVAGDLRRLVETHPDAALAGRMREVLFGSVGA